MSMGNYVFSTDALIETLKVDAGDEGSVHDMGGKHHSMMTEKGMAQVTTSPTTMCPELPTAIADTGAM